MFDDMGIAAFIQQQKENTQNALIAGGNAAVDEIYQVVPVSDINHKHLVETVKSEVTGGQQVTISAGEGLEDNRAFFVEFGTVKMAAQPYFFPSVTSPAVIDAIVNEMSK